MYRPAVLLLLALGGCNAHQSSATATESGSITAAALTQLDGTPLPADTLTGKVVVFVNVASTCGYTPQYEGLQALYEAHRDDGLVVVGVPCNQFGGQEPGDADEIAQFCKVNFGVSFPLMAKVDVNGPGASPLFDWLKGEARGVLGSKAIKWNFTKFLIDRDGTVVKRYGPSDKPAAIAADIEALL